MSTNIWMKTISSLKNSSVFRRFILLQSYNTASTPNYSNVEKNLFTLEVFIDLSKAFNSVDHEILISKLEKLKVRRNNFHWFKSYLSNLKQFIKYSNLSISVNDIIYGVPQCSILGPLLFLIYMNDLRYASKTLDPIIFCWSYDLILLTPRYKYFYSLFTWMIYSMLWNI